MKFPPFFSLLLSAALLLIHSDGSSGYEVLFHGGPIDGTPVNYNHF